MRIEDIDKAAKLKEKYNENKLIISELGLLTKCSVTLTYGATFQRPLPEALRDPIYHMLKDYYTKEQDNILQEITNL